jgi:uncharacterized protein YjbI with pentapeptide repeats
MTSDEEKFKALMAIRDKARAEQHADNNIVSVLKEKRDAYKKQLQSADDDYIEDGNLDYDEDNPVEEDDDEGSPLTSATLKEDVKIEEPWRPAAFSEHEDDLPILNIEFNGKNLENGEFNNEDLENANFSVANLSGVNFSGSNLRGADFSGANLTNTDLSDADLSGAIFAGAQLIGTNFTGAKMHNVVLTDVYFEDAILTDIDIDEITLEDLQSLIEYLAQYYPHKLNLRHINLTMLDLTRIDLSKINLRGVDFTGVNFTGVNISELDLSECIITHEQIAQALGRIPSAEELRRILAPKKTKPKTSKAIDFSDLFIGDATNYGVYNYAGMDGMSVDKLVVLGKKVFHKKEKTPPVKDSEALEKIREQNRANKEELRNVIEERKRRVLTNRRHSADIHISKGSNQR